MPGLSGRIREVATGEEGVYIGGHCMRFKKSLCHW